MAGCIVCGIDDSTGARKAARLADRLTRDLGARLVLDHATPVAPDVMYGVPFDNDAFQREAMEHPRRLLEEVPRACSSERISRNARTLDRRSRSSSASSRTSAPIFSS